MEQPIIIPYPVQLRNKHGCYVINNTGCISIPSNDSVMFSVAQRLQSVINNTVKIKLPIIIGNRNFPKSSLIFSIIEDLPKQGYILNINENTIEMKYSGCAGASYAVSTLKQLFIQCGRKIPCLEIEDKPDFEARGIMLDISSHKIPAMDTLYRFIDFMADLKLNQLQFNVEGFPFAYPSYPDVWKGQTPLTGEEIMQLDRYCRERFIDLVPNQNSFGHMTHWLSRKEFNNLAECPNGCDAPWGRYDKPLTLNPLDPQCIEFLQNTYDDLLPNFSSHLFNAGCDETFELGQGKSKELCDEIGKGRVYFNFLMKIYDLVKRHGKKMMFWGDIIGNHPEFIPELPRDIIALEWGYSGELTTFERCNMFKASGIPFYVCPGTSSWDSITGLTDNMKANLLNAAIQGRKNNAAGYLNTDWGCLNHWQHLPVSYPSFVYGAMLSWGVEGNRDLDIAVYLNKFVFIDSNNRMGQFALDIGNYYQKETSQELYHPYNGSGIYRTLRYSLLFDRDLDLDFLHIPAIEKKDFLKVKEYILGRYNDLDNIRMECEDARLIEAEYRNAMHIILHAAALGLFKLEKHEEEERKLRLEAMIEDLNEIIMDYKKIWLQRNRQGGLSGSIRIFEELKVQYIEALK